MNDFPGLFPTDFGLKARGKSAPMVPPLKPFTNLSSSSNFNFDSHPRPSTSSSRSSAPIGGPFDHPSSFPDSKSRDSRSKPGDAFNLDWSSGEKSAAPVFDKPIYDDDNFDGVAGMKNFVSTNYDDLLSTISPPPNDGNDFVDLLATLGKTDLESQHAPGQRAEETEAPVPGFDDLIPGFGAGGSSGRSSTRNEAELTRGSSKTTGGPFIILESGSSPPKNNSRQQPVKSNRASRSNEDQAHTAPSRSFEKTSNDSSGWNLPHGAAYIPSRSGGNSDSTDDVWLTVSDIPLFTQQTTAGPPSRPPPPKPVQAPKQENSCVDEAADGTSYAAASAAAMKEAMDMAEAKFRQVRERENIKAASRNRDGGVSWEREDTEGDQERARQEQLEREREEEERVRRRAEREKEKAKEIDRARHLVERATREARERAATDARLKAERAAVEKATAEARDRAERQAVQRALAEARERAARDAREKAQKASAAAAAAAAAVEKATAEAHGRTAKVENDVESFFGAGSRPSSAPKARVHPLSNEGGFDGATTFHGSRQSTSSDSAGRTTTTAAASAARGVSSSMRKASSTTSIIDDLSSVLRGPHSGDFQEVDGESEDRRNIRLQRHQKTQERAAHALAEKNERDLQAQRDQAERNRFSDTLDAEIRRWAAGKQGNLRALLASLHYVLWPESGWQPVSMGDLIEGAHAKRVYRKATLFVHPDKVQQRGATLQQKYIAEKVFDLLKEAFNKLNSEELF